MAKFGSKADDEPTPAIDRVIPSKEDRAAGAVPTMGGVSVSTTTFTSGSTMGMGMSAQPQVAAQAQIVQAEAQAEMDKKVLEAQLAKQDEHWMKAYWRPAMGWLYMLICFCDFVAFPVISMFLPVMIKGLPYVAWKSITLDNGGLIHLAFGAILGVTAYGRTQEKVQSKQ
jgi:uncharacterized membrane protein